MDVVESFRKYLKYAGKSERTIKHYVLHAQRFVDFLGKDPKKATKEDIMSFFAHLETDRRYSNRSLNVVGWSLKAFFQFLGRDDIAMWIPTPSFSVVQEPPWLPYDITMKIIEGDPVLTVAYDLALRLTEVTLLKRKGYNPETGEIEVYRLKRKGKTTSFIMRLSSTEPIVNSRELLNEYLAKRVDNDERLFKLTARAIQKRFHRRVENAGLHPSTITFHSLRHSRLTHIAIHQLKTKGYVDIVSLAKFAGHARPETTMMYVHLAHKHLAFSASK